MIRPPAASTARMAARRRAPAPSRRVITTKIGAIPIGSMSTAKVTAVSPIVDQFNAAAPASAAAGRDGFGRGGAEVLAAEGVAVSLFGCWTHDPVVAERADLRRRPRLELVRHDPLADLRDRRAYPLELLFRVLHRHLLTVEHVVVGLRRGLELPRL